MPVKCWLHSASRFARCELSPPWVYACAAQAAGKAEDTWWVAHLALPSANGTWPEEFGGRFYPPERGNCTSHWMEVRVVHHALVCAIKPPPAHHSRVVPVRAVGAQPQSQAPVA